MQILFRRPIYSRNESIALGKRCVLTCCVSYYYWERCSIEIDAIRWGSIESYFESRKTYMQAGRVTWSPFLNVPLAEHNKMSAIGPLGMPFGEQVGLQ